MARNPLPRNPITQLQAIRDDVLGRAQQHPATSRVLQSAAQIRDRVDESTRRVRGLDTLDRKVVELETRVAALEAAVARKPRARKSNGDDSG
jgi:hypothetical protein